ncbi:hypothetical protein E4U15_004030 [Claviceps sp. LM218 group G6]|nr:hypothetical protein E4U15_004030 [Claviceps sp. LM218 group G6]
MTIPKIQRAQGKVFKMTKFMASIYLKWPPENTTKIEVQAPKEMMLSTGQRIHCNVARSPLREAAIREESKCCAKQMRHYKDVSEDLSRENDGPTLVVLMPLGLFPLGDGQCL